MVEGIDIDFDFKVAGRFTSPFGESHRNACPKRGFLEMDSAVTIRSCAAARTLKNSRAF